MACFAIKRKFLGSRSRHVQIVTLSHKRNIRTYCLRILFIRDVSSLQIVSKAYTCMVNLIVKNELIYVKVYPQVNTMAHFQMRDDCFHII